MPYKDKIKAEQYRRNPEHKKRAKELMVIWNKQPKAKVLRKIYHLKWAYGITKEDYDKKLAAQNYRCDCCHRLFKDAQIGRAFKIVVDHDHQTNKNRGLLCNACNVALGHFEDSEDRLRLAMDYIRKWKNA